MATLANWLDAFLAVPKAIEAKANKIPKLSAKLQNFDDNVLPKGFTFFPSPPANGLPTFGISNLPKPPSLFALPMNGKYRAPLDRQVFLPPPSQPAVISGLNVDMPAATAKQVGYVYTSTGM